MPHEDDRKAPPPPPGELDDPNAGAPSAAAPSAPSRPSYLSAIPVSPGQEEALDEYEVYDDLDEYDEYDESTSDLEAGYFGEDPTDTYEPELPPVRTAPYASAAFVFGFLSLFCLPFLSVVGMLIAVVGLVEAYRSASPKSFLAAAAVLNAFSLLLFVNSCLKMFGVL